MADATTVRLVYDAFVYNIRIYVDNLVAAGSPTILPPGCTQKRSQRALNPKISWGRHAPDPPSRRALRALSTSLPCNPPFLETGYGPVSK